MKVGVWVTEATAVLGSLGVRGGDGGAGDLCSSTASNANWALYGGKKRRQDCTLNDNCQHTAYCMHSL